MRIITMRLIRHLLSHLLLISIIAGVCAVYFYRNQILPENYVQEIDHYANKIHPRLVAIASKKSSSVESQEAGVLAQQDNNIEADTNENLVADKALSDSSAVEEGIEKSEPESLDTTSPKLANQDQEVVVDSGVSNSPDLAMSDVPSAEDDKPSVVAEEKPSTDIQGKPTSDKEAASSDDLLRSARLAFNQGELDVAVSKYNELIELENDEADFYGELGNVYYAMGSWDKAGVAYYEAATRLIETGQLAQVGYLQRVLQGLDAERAEKLNKQMINMNRGM